MIDDLSTREEQAHSMSSLFEPVTPTKHETDAEVQLVKLNFQLDKLDKEFREAGIFDVINRVSSSEKFPDVLLEEFEPAMADYKARHASEKVASAKMRIKMVPALCLQQATTVFKDKAPPSWPGEGVVWLAAPASLKAEFLTMDCKRVATEALNKAARSATRDWKRCWTTRIQRVRSLSDARDVAKIAATPRKVLAKFKSAMFAVARGTKRPRFQNGLCPPRKSQRFVDNNVLTFDEECCDDDVLSALDIP